MKDPIENTEETPEEGIEENNNGDSHEEILDAEIVAEEILKDPLDILKEQIDEKDTALAEQRNEHLRKVAEMENFKKRLKKEKEDFLQFANEKLLKELLPIKDNLERALSAENSNIETIREGVEMTLKQFDALLEKQKVELIEAVGKIFDPSKHEVLCQIESEEHPENTVTEEYSKGYHLHGRILRPSKVVVSKGPAAPAKDPGDQKDSPDSEENADATQTQPEPSTE